MTRILVAVLITISAALAQPNINIVPPPPATDTGSIKFWGIDQTHNIAVRAPQTLGSSTTWRFPNQAVNTTFAGLDVVNQTWSAANIFNGDVTLTQKIFTGVGTRVQGNLIPQSDNSYELGSSALRWKKLWVYDLDCIGTCGTAGLPVDDHINITKNHDDPTKLARFDNSLITTGTQRVYTFQDQDMTLPGLEFLNVFTVDQVINANLGINSSFFDSVNQPIDFDGPGTSGKGIVLKGQGSRGNLDFQTGASAVAEANVGALSFTGYYSGTANKDRLSLWRGRYCGTTSGDYGGCFDLWTKADGGNLTARVRFDQSGAVMLLSPQATPSVGASLKLRTYLQTTSTMGLLPNDNQLDIFEPNARPHTIYAANIDAAPDVHSTDPGYEVYGIPHIKGVAFQVADIGGVPSNFVTIKAIWSSSFLQEFQIVDPSSTAMLALRRRNGAGVNEDRAVFDVTMIPSADNTRDIGTNANRWKDLWLSGTCHGCAGLPVPDSSIITQSASDATKQMRFSNTGITSGHTSVLSVQEGNYTLAGYDIAQTWTIDQTMSANHVWMFGDTNAPGGGGHIGWDSSGTGLFRIQVGDNSGYRYAQWDSLGLGINNTPTAGFALTIGGQTQFQSHLKFNANETLDIGDTTNRGGTVYSRNFMGASSPGISGYGPTPPYIGSVKFEAFDSTGFANFFYHQAQVNGVNKYWCFYDDTSACMLQLTRKFLSTDLNQAIFDMDLLPKTDSARDIGASTSKFKDIWISGTCHGCSSSSGPEIWIDSYGGDPSGTVDSYSAFTVALSHVPATGGCVVFGAGTYKMSQSLVLGDGSSHGYTSTRESQCLKGQGVGATTIKYIGASSSSTAVVKIDGSMRWGRIENLTLDANGLAGYGLQTLSAPNLYVQNLWVTGTTTYGYYISTQGTGGSSTSCNMIWEKIASFAPASGGGMYLAGDWSAINKGDPCSSVFRAVFLSYQNPSYGLYIGFADSITFDDLQTQALGYGGIVGTGHDVHAAGPGPLYGAYVDHGSGPVCLVSDGCGDYRGFPRDITIRHMNTDVQGLSGSMGSGGSLLFAEMSFDGCGENNSFCQPSAVTGGIATATFSNNYYGSAQWFGSFSQQNGYMDAGVNAPKTVRPQFNVGDQTQSSTNAQNGWSVFAFVDGDVYQDTKTYSNGNLHFRIGNGTDTYGGATREYMKVYAPSGAVTFNSLISSKSNLFFLRSAVGTNSGIRFKVDGSPDDANGDYSLTTSAGSGGTAVFQLNMGSFGFIASRTSVEWDFSGNMDLKLGAFKMGGISVIDSSRNMTPASLTTASANITSLTVSSCSGCGGGGASLSGTNTWTGVNTFSATSGTFNLGLVVNHNIQVGGVFSGGGILATGYSVWNGSTLVGAQSGLGSLGTPTTLNLTKSGGGSCTMTVIGGLITGSSC